MPLVSAGIFFFYRRASARGGVYCPIGLDGKLARTPIRALEGHLRYVASLDAGGREDPPRAIALAQSFLARPALCDRARADDLVHPVSRARVRHRLRLRRSRARVTR